MIKKLFTLSLVLFSQSVFSQTDVEISGPGYPDLDNKAINYSYQNASGFKILIEDNTLTFEGTDGAFAGSNISVKPQVQKIDEGIYFMSWSVMGPVGDNVVMNLNNNKVDAHIAMGSNISRLHGTVDCFGERTDCALPEGEPNSIQDMLRGMMSNNGDAPAENDQMPMSEGAPTAGYDALQGMVLHYSTEEGLEVKLNVRGNEVVVDEGQGAEAFKAQYSLVAEDIYFISWGAPRGGQHIVFNAKTNEVFDQIDASGKRVSINGTASCFGTLNDCTSPKLTDDPTTVALIGSTGMVGKHMLRALLDKGYQVKALARTPSKLDGIEGDYEIIQGDVLDKGTVRKLMTNADIVMSSLGPVESNGDEGNLMLTTKATKNVTDLMHELGTEEYLLVSGASLVADTDDRDFRGWLLEKAGKWLMGDMMVDRQAEYDYLATTDVKWTVVRCPGIQDEAYAGTPAELRLDTIVGMNVRAGEVAEFLIAEIDSDEYLHKAPFIGSAD